MIHRHQAILRSVAKARGARMSVRWNSGPDPLVATTPVSTSTPAPAPAEVSESTTNNITPKRGTKLPPKDQKFVILSAKESSILPRHRAFTRKSMPKFEQIDVQLKKLLVFKSEVDDEVLLDSISKMKPRAIDVSVKRYEQLKNDIIRAYSKVQLKLYLSERANMKIIKSSMKKDDMARHIIDKFWKIRKSFTIDEASDVIVENSIDLSSRDLFIILSNNGKLPRSWSKSGAKIVVLGDEQKIIIRSTADTFEWINASIMKTLNSIHRRVLSTEKLSSLIDVSSLPFNRIQRLSDVYIAKNGHTLEFSAIHQDSLDQASRLILGATGLTFRLDENYLVDSSEDNIKKGVYAPFVDDDSMSWIDREKDWCRWRFPRTRIAKQKINELAEEVDLEDIFHSPSKSFEHLKNVSNLQHPSLELVSKSSSSKINLESLDASLSTNVADQYTDLITDSLLKSFELAHENSHRPSEKSLDATENKVITIAATFGCILQEHEANNDNSTANFVENIAKVKTTFQPNIPSVFEFSSTLPLLSSESEQSTENVENQDELLYDEEYDPKDSFKLSRNGNGEKLDLTETFFSNGKSPKEALESLEEMNLDVENSSDVDNHTYQVQIKFVPNPFHEDTPDNFQTLPTLELWVDIDHKETADFSTANLVAVTRESVVYSSLAHKNSDLKVSATEAQFIDIESNEGVVKYLAKSQLNFSGRSKIFAPLMMNVKLTPDAEPAQYMYQSMAYRKQIDLQYNDHLLQLSSIEGGLIGGHKVEANLILDIDSNAQQDLDRTQVKSFVKDALQFVDEMEPINMAQRNNV